MRQKSSVRRCFIAFPLSSPSLPCSVRIRIRREVWLRVHNFIHTVSDYMTPQPFPPLLSFSSSLSLSRLVVDSLLLSLLCFVCSSASSSFSLSSAPSYFWLWLTQLASLLSVLQAAGSRASGSVLLLPASSSPMLLMLVVVLLEITFAHSLLTC